MDSSNKFVSMGFAKGLSLILLIMLPACSTTIKGKLSNLSGSSINSDDARVNVISLTNNKSIPQILSVDSDGRFVTKGDLDNGNYMIEALVPGYKPLSVQLTVDSTQEIILKLTPSKQIENRTYKYRELLDESRGQGAANLVPPMTH